MKKKIECCYLHLTGEVEIHVNVISLNSKSRLNLVRRVPNIVTVVVFLLPHRSDNEIASFFLF